MLRTYELQPIFSSRKSYYNKANVKEETENGKLIKLTLVSYVTDICTIENNELKFVCDVSALSNTTLRHINEFMYQNGYKVLGKRDLIKKYFQ